MASVLSAIAIYECILGQTDELYRQADIAQHLGEAQNAIYFIEKAKGLERWVVDLIYVPGR